MALDAQATKLANLIDPEVMGQLVTKKFFNKLKFAGLAVIDYTLVGRPGSKVTEPAWTYIGMAEDVLEGADIPIKQLSQTSVEFTIKKAGIGIQITDESLLSGLGNALEQGASQIAASISQKVNADSLAALRTVGVDMTVTGALSYETLVEALVTFGEDDFDDNGNRATKVLMVNSKNYGALLLDPTFLTPDRLTGNLFSSAVVGGIAGMQVIVSDDLTDTEAYVVKPGALKIFMKRDFMLERDRDIINKSFIVTADKHYGVYLYDESKAIKVTIA